MIYKISYYDGDYENKGFDFVGNVKKARHLAKAERTNNPSHHTEITQFKTPKTKQEVLDVLSIQATHNDNG